MFLRNITALVLGAGLLQGAGLGQSDSPEVKSKVIGTHQNMHLAGTHVIFGQADGAKSGLMFRTDDLPEGKPITIVVDLTKELTPDQMKLASNYKLAKTIKVTCQSIDVVEMTGAQTGKSAKMAHGKVCTLDSLVADNS